jgi:DedD protein
MSHLLDDEEDDLRSSQDRELTLSTTSILGIFFGLVLLCGLFFAFGYNMGSHKTSSTTDTADTTSAPATPSANFNAFKPAAGSPAASSSSGEAAYPPAASTTSTTTTSTDHATASISPSSAPIVRTTPASTEHPVTPISVAPATPGTGSFMVQIAAVSHQEDADLLVSALRSKGYAVGAHQSPADQLLHIQVGPFTNRKDAEAMRQRLLGDGYNAIVK